MRCTFSLFSSGDGFIATDDHLLTWYEPRGEQARTPAIRHGVGSLDDLRVEGVVRTSELPDGRYPVIATGSFVVTVESPFYALHSLRIRVEGDWIGDVWFAPFEDLLSRRFVARAFVCDDAVEYVVADLIFDDVPDAIGLIISMAMAAHVPPGVVIEVLDTPPIAASTAPRCMQCGEQFDHQGARMIGGLLSRPVPSVFAITCPAHHPALALIPKEICHA